MRDDLALLLLERLPVLMNGKRSFIIENLGVSTTGCDGDEAWLGASDGRYPDRRGVDPGLLSLILRICSKFGSVLSGVTSLYVSGCGGDFSRTGVAPGVWSFDLFVGVVASVVT
jgi:hypothetical protein